MKRETWTAFAVPLAIAALLRLAVAAEFIFRPDGWDSFDYANHAGQALRRDTAAGLFLAAVAALAAFTVWRLRTAKRKGLAAGAIALSLFCAPALFVTALGEPSVKLYLGKQRYDAAVAARPNDPAVVFDWGQTTNGIIGRTLEYLVFARGDQDTALRRFEADDNGGVEAYIQEDEIMIRRSLSEAWDNPATRENRFKILVLDNCRMQVHHLTGGYFYIVDAC